MKKMIPVISPIIVGLFGGLFVECAMCALSIMMSPFSDSAQIPPFIRLILIAILPALFIALMAIANTAYLMNLNDMKKAKTIAVCQALAALVLFFVSWSFSGFIVDEISKLF